MADEGGTPLPAIDAMRQALPAALEVGAVLVGTAVFASSRTFQPYMLAGFVLLAAGPVLHRVGTGTWRRATPLDRPLLLFVVGALVGVWAAYDRPVAAVKCCLIVSAVALCLALAGTCRWAVVADAAALALTTFGVALAVYSVTQTEYNEQTAKVAAVARLGVWINGIVPRLFDEPPHPNRTAGVLAVILPVTVAWAAHLWRDGGRRRPASWACLVAAAVMVFAVMMTLSRGAWLALAAMAVAAAAAWYVQQHGRVLALIERWGRGVGVVVVASAVAGVWGLHLQGRLLALLGSVPAGDRLMGRAELYGQVWRLTQDYLFTGHGLGMFPMVHATYSLLIHVPYLPHAHNLFLQVWLEQGIVGAAAFVWLIVVLYAWLWRERRSPSWLRAGALLATTGMLVHGLVDAALYSNRVLPFMFVPIGLAMAGVPGVGSGRRLPVDRRWWLAAGAAVALAGVMMGGRLAATWQANLGAVAQARIELGQYRWPDRLVEYTRRQGQVAGAAVLFEGALTWDQGNVTANQRLASVALAQGRYQAAERYLAAAYERDRGSEVTWQLMCEAYLGLGRLDEAYAWCRRTPGSAAKLDGIAIVRYDKSGDKERAAWARALARRIRDEQ